MSQFGYVLHTTHFTEQGLESTIPSIDLLASRRVEDEVALGIVKIREAGWVTVLLAEIVIFLMLFIGMEYVNNPCTVFEILDTAGLEVDENLTGIIVEEVAWKSTRIFGGGIQTA